MNINKVATLRNARGGNLPDIIQFAKDCERFGADGITVHPRPDERHIRYRDVYALKEVVTTEFNIEGNPTQEFLDLVLEAKPHQVTLVPDANDAITSDHGWDTKKHREFLYATISQLKMAGIRVSIFIDPVKEMIENAAMCGTNRIELYTGPYAELYSENKEQAISPFVTAANFGNQLGLEINAGHDLNLFNLSYFKHQVQPLHEVSIGHALISDSLYFGIENTIGLYQKELSR